MEVIDTHCHLTFEPLSGDVEDVLARSRATGVCGWVTVGTDSGHNRKAVELANRFENVRAAVGIHPHYASKVRAKDLHELKRLGQNNHVVAVGETGLDFHYNYSPPAAQRRVFAEQLKIAGELGKPVIVHSREAFDETLEVLDNSAAGVEKVVFHCFTGSAEQAKVLLEKGFHLSFTGVVTFRNANAVRRAAEVVPLERMMLETDCPFMSPEPVRKQKVNEPAFLVHTARFVANVKSLDLSEFAGAVSATSKEFFSLGDGFACLGDSKDILPEG